MYKFVYLLMFGSLSIGNCVSEYVSVTMDIEDKGSGFVCKSRNSQENLKVGDEIRLYAILPPVVNSIAYMWCENSMNVTVDRCTQTEAQCISTSLYAFSRNQQGTWRCLYYMNTILDPPNVTLYKGQNYTLATCTLNFKAVDYVNVTMDIEDKRSGFECKSRNSQENLMEGDGVQLVANLPHVFNSTVSMTCSNSINEIVSEQEFYPYTQTQTQLVTTSDIPFSRDLQGPWECSFNMSTTRPINYKSKNYALATCTLNFIAVDKLWFTGLVPNRRIITEMADHSGFKYSYTYENGERLNISCDSNPDVKIYYIKFIDLKGQPTNLTGQRFEKVADYSLHETSLFCYSHYTWDNTKKYTIQLDLKSKAPGELSLRVRIPLTQQEPWTSPKTSTASLPPSVTTKTPTPRASPKTSTASLPPSVTTNAPRQGSPILEIEGKGLKYSTDSDTMPFETDKIFSEPEIIPMKCIFNKKGYDVALFDGGQPVASGNAKPNSKVILSHNFTLDHSNKTLECRATENDSTKPRNFTIIVDFKYEPINDGTTASVTTTKSPEMTTDSEKGEDETQSFLEKNWKIIVICCAVLITICVVAYCAKILCTRKKSPPPDDYVNLTNDRGNDYPTQTAPSRTMPRMESNYCNPKDIQGRKNNIEPDYCEPTQGRKNNIEPNYSEPTRGMGEGLYAELNRPEDTYAEPYIDKTELYARPIPKAERRKKDDPNYGNIFGQDYVNSKK